MASIGDIWIAGNNVSNNKIKVKSAVVFFLDKKSTLDKLYSFSKESWEVELKEDHLYIVGRSFEKMTLDKIVTQGFKFCQKLLDVISIESKEEFKIKNPISKYMVLFEDEDKKINLKYYTTINFELSMKVTGIVIDKDGNETEIKKESNIKWIPALRFYRLSQDSSDIFEAYRNLYLGFESLLHEINPKTKKEGERAWISRALTEVKDKISLKKLLFVDKEDPVDYFMKNQYTNIRCKLFHAKGNLAILPYHNIDIINIKNAYEELLKIWKELAYKYFEIPHNDNDRINLTIKELMDGVLEKGFKFIGSNDANKPTENDKEIKFLGKKTYHFNNLSYKEDIKKGKVLLTGELKDIRNVDEKIYKIDLILNENIASINYIPNGINLLGLNKFEFNQYFGLLNNKS